MTSHSFAQTGERGCCLVGERADIAAIVSARPIVIATPDRIREHLEELGNGLGVTDLVSGDAVMELRT